MDADGGHAHTLPHDDRAWFEGWPVWSPNGRWIAYQRAFDRAMGQPITVTSADGGGTPVETGPQLAVTGARIEWSPDSTRILMIPNDRPRQVLLDPSGGPASPLPWDSPSYPSWQRLVP